MDCILNLVACWCSELLGAHEPLARFLLRDAHAAIQLERELEPEPWQPQTTRSSGHVALRPRDEVFAADARQVAYQAGVTEAVARDALARNGYEMVVAVLDLATGNGRAPL